MSRGMSEDDGLMAEISWSAFGRLLAIALGLFLPPSLLMLMLIEPEPARPGVLWGAGLVGILSFVIAVPREHWWRAFAFSSAIAGILIAGALLRLILHKYLSDPQPDLDDALVWRLVFGLISFVPFVAWRILSKRAA